MYIKKILLKNIRCFKELTIELESARRQPKWLMILGDNGVGKTTILRSIAMGLSDVTSASGMLSELSGTMVRHGCKYGEIQIEVSQGGRSKSFGNKIILKKGPGGVESVRAPMESEKGEFPSNRIFICGYGAARRAIGSEAPDKYKLIDAVYTLFNYDASLQNVELPFYRLSHGEINSVEKSIFRRIESILELPDNSIRLDKSGISIKGPWGEFIPTGALGDGYAATLAWISDMIGWAMLYQKSRFEIDLPGIVLIDEIEHHLHPSWQKKIISSLHSQFPSIQFITTTHAPMCAVGTTDLDDDECELIKLMQRDEYVEGTAGHKPPRGKRADQVLTSYLFELATSGDRETREQIEKYSALLSKKVRNANEKKQLQDLRSVLDQKLGSAESEFEQRVREAVRQVLISKSGSQDEKPQAVDYEIRRQLKELLE